MILNILIVHCANDVTLSRNINFGVVPQGFTCTITLISCVGNGNYCLTCGSDKTVRLWNPHKGLRIKTYSGHGAEVLDADAYVIECMWLIIIAFPLPDTQGL